MGANYHSDIVFVGPFVAGPASTLPSGPNDQIMIGLLASKVSPTVEGRVSPFQPLSVPLASERHYPRL